MPVHPELLRLAAAHDPMTVELMCDWAFGPRGKVGGSPQPGGWLQGAARALLGRADPAVLSGDLEACAAYESGEEAAAAVRCPVRVVVGAADRMTPPKAGRHLAGLIGNAAITTIDDAGHMVMIESPAVTLAAIRDCLRR